jgi:plasmid stabilization system protein ParE
MGWKVGLSERAERDLEQVVAFLAQRNVGAAERLGLRLIETIFALPAMPYQGRAVHARPGYRRVLQRPWFVIFYRVDETRQWIEIVRIWDARQDPALFALD